MGTLRGYRCGLLALAVCSLLHVRAETELYDVAVVGLGPSGLAALTRLTELGYKVIGLEAKDRIGGRVNTQEFGGGLVEFGAEWIHGEGDNPTYLLAREHNVPILDMAHRTFQPQVVSNAGYNQSLVLELYDYCGKVYDNEIAAQTNDSLGEYITKKFYEYVSTKPGVAENKDFCKNFLLEMELLLASLDGFDSWHDESVRGSMDYHEYEGSQGWSWHKLGYRTLFDILLHKYNNGTALPVELRLSSEVSAVDWSQEGRVALTAAGQVFHAKTAIITVSLGVLQHSHTTLFKPALPAEKVRAIEALTLGVVDKICLHYEQIWWPDSDDRAFFFIWTDEDRSKVSEADWWVTQISSMSVPMSNDHVVTLWITGAGARHMETLALETVREKTKWLLQLFFKDVPDAKDIRRSAWYSDPHVRGSYSFHGRATDALRTAGEQLAAPLAPRLQFAGEASNAHHFSTVHGALETGWREADRYHSLNKQDATTVASTTPASTTPTICKFK